MQGKGDDPVELSVVVPFFNEEDNIGRLYEKLSAVLDELPYTCEMVFVDDGSKDRTFERARELALGNPRLRVIRFRRNYGQTPAMVAGIDHSRGKVIITMDGDLQNDPADIPLFLEKINEGYDIVVGWRHRRQDKLITRKIPSMIANRLIGKVTGVPIKDNGCSLKAYRADIIQSIPLYSEMHRFIPAMMSLAGVKIAEIKVNHFARQFGESKYGLSRIYKVLLDLIGIKTLLASATRPLVWFGVLAGGATLVALAALVLALLEIYGDPAATGLVWMGVSLLFGSLAVFLVSSGVFSELVYRTGDIRIDRLSLMTSAIQGMTESARNE